MTLFGSAYGKNAYTGIENTMKHEVAKTSLPSYFFFDLEVPSVIVFDNGTLIWFIQCFLKQRKVTVLGFR